MTRAPLLSALLLALARGHPARLSFVEPGLVRTRKGTRASGGRGIVLLRAAPSTTAPRAKPSSVEVDAGSSSGSSSSFVESVTRLGAAGALSLVVETVGFWLFVMGPAAAFMFHRETGDWVPGDREAARQFAQFFASVWVFCRIPPVEGARWALVFALAPWLQDHVIGAVDDKPR